MSKPCLSDRILLSVEKPARYTGNEINAVSKDKDGVDIRFAMCFPDVYEIGMSHLGIQIIYNQLNSRKDTWCERVYSPWPDLAGILKKESLPLFALESQEPVREFDFLGFTLQYELCYSNVLQVLELSRIPFYSTERDDSWPLIIGGGPCAYNPEPLADFFDLFYIGDSEATLPCLLDLYKEMKNRKASKCEFLYAASQVPGVYVPSLYSVCYQEDGTILSFSPVSDSVPAKIRKQVCMDLDHAAYPEKPLVPFLRPTQDRVTLEIQRGCIRGCRFCQAGMLYRPLREKSLDTLKKEADAIINHSGYDEISLSSLSSSDYRQLPELMDYLVRNFSRKNVNISLPSLRIDNFSLEVMSKVQDIKKSSLTFAPEAGTQRLRDVINKGITESDIFDGASMAFRGGWNKVKLYFMLGLPAETDDDRKGIARLAQAICDKYYEIPKEDRNGKCEINVSTSFFVPKPFTPFQWAQMYRTEDYLDFAHTVREEIKTMKNSRSIRYNWHEADGTVLEGVFARGDRKLSRVIETAYRDGASFDSWSDFFNMETWLSAFRKCGIDPEFYTLRKRSEEEILPWDFIDIGVTKDFLISEWHKAEKEIVTPNCREACQGCGARSYGSGVCFEKIEKTDVFSEEKI